MSTPSKTYMRLDDERSPMLAPPSSNSRKMTPRVSNASSTSRPGFSQTTPKKEDDSNWVYARTSVLGVVCFFLMSAMMCDEVVAAAVPTIKDTVGLDSSQVGLLYSSTFVPSLTFVVLGGLLHHKIGVRALSILSSLSVITGMIVFAMSENFWGMVAGRVLFGLGLGPTELVNDIISLRWFDNETTPSIEIAFGLIGSFGMLGFVIAFNLMPYLLELFDYLSPVESLRMALLCLAFIPTMAVMINIYYLVLDWYAEPILELDLTEEESHSILDTVKELGLAYWLLFIINASTFALMYVIMLYSVDYMVEKWDYDEPTAGRYSSGVYIAGIIVSPFTGVFIHKFGKMISLILLGTAMFGTGCIMLAATHVNPLVGLLSIGFGLAMLETTVWTAVAEVVPETSFGPAFAFLSAAVSIVLVVVPYLAGFMHDTFDSYDPVAYLCSGGAVIGAIATIALYFISPTLQNPSEKYKNYYIVKIVSRKKPVVPHRPRRHSITEGEVKQIVGYLTETDAFEDLLVESNSENPRPRLFDILGPGDQEKWHQAGSLPKDFFSQLVSHSATLVPIEEHPMEKASEQLLLEEAHIKSELSKDQIDLEKIWEIKESKSRTSSDAPRMKPSSTPDPNSKIRTVSDVSALEWFKKTRDSLKKKKAPVDTTKDDTASEVEWTPSSITEDDIRQRTTSDLTHTNWNKYGKVQPPPSAPSTRNNPSSNLTRNVNYNSLRNNLNNNPNNPNNPNSNNPNNPSRLPIPEVKVTMSDL